MFITVILPYTDMSEDFPVEYYWGTFGYPFEDCDLKSLNSVSAWSWTGTVGTPNISKFDFTVGQPDPRGIGQITAIYEITHSYQATPEIEIIICLSGSPGATTWEKLRPVAYYTSAEALRCFESESPWVGTPIILEPEATPSETEANL